MSISTAYNWFLLDPDTKPLPRENASMSYDEINGNVIMFGGGASREADIGSTFNDTDPFDLSGMSNETWIWNGVTWRLANPTTKPPRRQAGGMAFEPVNGGMLLYGGIVDDSVAPAIADRMDTWFFDVATEEWTRLFPAHNCGERWEFAMSNGPTGVGMMAGFSAFPAGDANSLVDGPSLENGWVFLWDAAAQDWTWPTSSLTIGGHPYAYGGFGFAATHDKATDEIIGYGGGATGFALNRYTNIWDGTGDGWFPSNDPPTYPIITPNPGPRALHGMGYLACSSKIVMWGGYYSESFDEGSTYVLDFHRTMTWVFDSSARTWEEHVTASHPDPYAEGYGQDVLQQMVGHISRDNIVLFTASGETWVFECIGGAAPREFLGVRSHHMTVPLNNVHPDPQP